MSESRKITIPDTMEAAARRGYEAWRSYCRPEEQYTNGAIVALESALRWLDVEIRFLLTEDKSSDYEKAIQDVLNIFLAAPEPPEQIRDMMLDPKCYSLGIEKFNAAVIEAFNRGRRLGEREP